MSSHVRTATFAALWLAACGKVEPSGLVSDTWSPSASAQSETGHASSSLVATGRTSRTGATTGETEVTFPGTTTASSRASKVEQSSARRSSEHATTVSSNASSTATSTAKHCGPMDTFSAPVPIPDLSSAARDDGLSLSPDGLTAYLSSERGSPSDQIFVTSRASATGTFGPAALVPGIGQADQTVGNFAPRISTDGLRLYLGSTRNAGSGYVSGNAHIYVATRGDVSSQFQEPQLVGVINGPTSNDKDEYLTPDETSIYFSSNRDGQENLFWATKSSGGAFGQPTEISELASPGDSNTILPVVTADQLTLFFATDRAGPSGNMDIWMALRSDATAPFGTPQALRVLNTPNIDYPLWLSSDECTLYIASGPYASPHFFKATRGG